MSSIPLEQSTSLDRSTSGRLTPVDWSTSEASSPCPEREPLLISDSDTATDAEDVKVGQWAIACLLLQHVSSTFTSGIYNFAAFLFLIEVYRDTLVPASLVGFCTQALGLSLSGYMGSLVDRIPRLSFVRRAIGAQKTLQAGNYALFLILFGPLRDAASDAFHGRGEMSTVISVWTILCLTIVCSSGLGLADTGLTVAVERDWVVTIARNDSTMLTKLNTYMRRIDLISKLCAPLFVSVLTSLWGYSAATMMLLGISLATAATELVWIGTVYSRFPVLRVQDSGNTSERQQESSWSDWLKQEMKDWTEFAHLPVFGSEYHCVISLTDGSLAIATIYLTTLSYDGTFIAYVKAARGWDDAFIAIMRGVCVLTGLLGTVVMPALESRIGLERAGAWSIWFEAACLLPTVVSFFLGSGKYGQHGPTWNSLLLFGGIATSRVGLWSFDLCQLKVLQLATEHHPRRNKFMALQIALQNVCELAKYAVTLMAATPAQFKWTAVVSYAAVITGGVAYAFFLRSVRGHLVHLECLKWKAA